MNDSEKMTLEQVRDYHREQADKFRRIATAMHDKKVPLRLAADADEMADAIDAHLAPREVLATDAQLIAMGRVIAAIAGESWDSIGQFAQQTIKETQLAALQAASLPVAKVDDDEFACCNGADCGCQGATKADSLVTEAVPNKDMDITVADRHHLFIYEVDFGDGEKGRYIRLRDYNAVVLKLEDLIAQGHVGVREGCKLVPVEPTGDMVNAYVKATSEYLGTFTDEGWKNAKRDHTGVVSNVARVGMKAAIEAAPPYDDGGNGNG